LKAETGSKKIIAEKRRRILKNEKTGNLRSGSASICDFCLLAAKISDSNFPV